MGDNLTAYLILLLMVVIVELFKGRIGIGSKGSTAVSAEIHSPAEPVVIYENSIDKYVAEHYPNARR